MGKVAVIDHETKKLIRVIDSDPVSKKEFSGQNVEFVTSKTFKPTEQFATWDEMIGNAKPVEGEAPVKETKAAKTPKEPKAPKEPKPASDRPAPAALEGAYHLLKPLPTTPADHPKMPIWNAIESNNGKTVAEAKAACPAENPKRKTSGVYTFASEFRYFLKTGYAAMGPIPEGFDYKAVAAKPVAEPKAKKEKAPAPEAGAPSNTDASASKNQPAEGAQTSA